MTKDYAIFLIPLISFFSAFLLCFLYDIFKLICLSSRVRERPQRSETLHHVFELGNTIQIEKMLKEKAIDLSVKDPKGYTPLHYACRNGKLHCLEYVMNSQYVYPPFSKLLRISSGYIFGNTPLTIKDDSDKVILHHACEKGSVQLVKKLLAAGAHPNVSDKYNCTPLHYACKRKDLEIIRVLLKRGANPNAVDVLTGTPLHYACKTGNLYLVQTLIEAGADRSIKRWSDGNTPLHDAVEGGFFHCVDSLVNYNPSPGARLPIIHGIFFTRTTPLNIGNRCGKRVLHIACMKGSLNMVEKLLVAGANPNVLDDDANTPLHNACQGGFVHIVDRLIRKGASCTAKNKLGYIPLHYACSKGYVQCAQRIIADNTSYQLRITTKYMHGDTPLTVKDPTTQKVIFHHACEQGNREVVKMLIKEGADPTVQDFQGFTPLHYAFQNDQWECANYLVDYCKHKLCQTEVVRFLSQFLLLACKQDDMEICRELIGLGGDNLVLTDNTGRTPLDYACENKNLPFMHSLIDYYTKITLNAKDKQILQPVVFFAFKEGNIDLLQKLLPMGIDLTVKDANGYSPLHYACKLGHVHCLEHVMNSQNVSNLDELLKMCGRDGNTSLTVKGESDRVILHHACAKGSMKLVDTLISSGATVNVKDRENYTPLFHACWRRDLTLVKKLIDAGSNPNAACCDIGTPLHFAFKNGDANLVECLLASGAQLSVAYDTSPLHYAHGKKYLQCVDHVIKHCMEKMTKTEAMQALSPFLFAACTRGDVDVLKRLMEVDVNFTVQDEKGYTALHYACENHQLHCLEYVISHLDHPHVHSLLQISSGGIFGTTPLTVKDNSDKVILHHASEKGSVQLVKKLLEVGAKPDVSDAYNCTPLHYACKGGFVDVVSDLITAGTNCRAEDKCGYTPIHYACQNGHLQCLDYLIDHCGPSILKMAVRDVSGTTPLTIVAPTSHNSVLHHACIQGNLKIMEMFIKEGADPKIQNSEHFTPLHYACLNGHFKCAECIINHCTETMPTTECRLFLSSILSFSCKKGNIDVIKKLVGVGIDFTVDDLCSACQNSNLECVEYLIANHPYPNRFLKMTSKDGKTPVAVRNSFGQTIFHVACAKGNVEVVKRLLATGADPAVKVEQSKKTPLHIACENGQWQCVDIICANCPKSEKLLQIFDKTRQSPVCTKDSSGKVILHHACETGNLQLVKNIFSAGRTSTVKDNRGCTPFCSACTNGHFQCAEYVINHTGYPNSLLKCAYHDYKSQSANNPLRNKDRNGLTLMHFLCTSGNAEVLKQIVGKDSTLGFKMTDNYGNTPLHFACQYGHLRCVEILIDIYPKYMLQVDRNRSKTGSVSEHMASEEHSTTSSSPLSKSDKSGKNMLHHACEMGNVELVGKLISFGVSVHQVDNDGHTPLHYACKGDHVRIVEKYVELASGPNLKVQDQNGYTPLHYACRNGNLRCVECLTDVNKDPYQLFQVKSKDGFSPLAIKEKQGGTILYRACQKKDKKLLHKLAGVINPYAEDADGYTLFMYVAMYVKNKQDCLYILQACVKVYQGDINFRHKSSQKTALHLACESGNLPFIDQILKCGALVNLKDNKECTPLLVAFRNLKHLSSLSEFNLLDLVNLLIAKHCDVKVKDTLGNTALHYAAECDQSSVPLALISAGSDITYKNNADKTFSDRASPKLLAEVKKNLLEIERRQIVCVIGYQECGKSTLIASLDETLQLRSQGAIYRLYSRYFRQASLIEARTAGIDTKALNSDSAGELVFFDFAGHAEYYVSHFAFLESALSAQGVSVMFIMVVDLRCPEEERLDQCRTWLIQLNTILKNVKNRNKNSVAKVLLVGSHLDHWWPSPWKHTAAVDSLKGTLKELEQSLNSSYMSFVDCWGMDCRSLDSKGIRMLEKYLIQSRNSPSDDNSANKVPLGACILFDRLKNVHVSITVEGIIKELHKGSTPAPFPLEPEYIDELCQELAASGLALYIPDRSTAGNVNGWLILQMDVLLSRVHGKIFAPDNPQFPMHHKDLASVYGLVDAEDLELALTDCGPQMGFDVEMLKKILEVFEFYHIVDTKFLSEDIVKLSCSDRLNSKSSPSQWLYFPSLVRKELPNIQELFPVHDPNLKWLCWELRTKYIFPPLFQQALFVRFGAKFVQHTDECKTEDTPFLYNVGKNGMFWSSEFGVHIRVNIANKSIVRILACSTQVNRVVNQVADLAQEVHFVSHYHDIQAQARVRKVHNGSLLACSFLVSNVIDVVKNGGTHAINLLDPYPKGVALTEVFSDWDHSLHILEKMAGEKYSNPDSTVKIGRYHRKSMLNQTFTLFALYVYRIHCFSTFIAFNSEQFMDKYRGQFLDVVAAKDIAGRLEIAHILSESEYYFISKTDPMDARERMYRYLRDNADRTTIGQLCDIMLNMTAYPKMKALGKQMKEDEDLNLSPN